MPRLRRQFDLLKCLARRVLFRLQAPHLYSNPGRSQRSNLQIVPGQPIAKRLFGELLPSVANLNTADFPSSVALALNVNDEPAIESSGRSMIMVPGAFLIDKTLKPNAEQILISEKILRPMLSTPGRRLWILDEVFWRSESGVGTETQIASACTEAHAIITLVGKVFPQARLGITFSPYAYLSVLPEELLNNKYKETKKK